jgi:hypothetical protein
LRETGCFSAIGAGHATFVGWHAKLAPRVGNHECQALITCFSVSLNQLHSSSEAYQPISSFTPVEIEVNYVRFMPPIPTSRLPDSFTMGWARELVFYVDRTRTELLSIAEILKVAPMCISRNVAPIEDSNSKEPLKELSTPLRKANIRLEP